MSNGKGSDMEIGPRQKVDRAKHPTLGEGRAIYENGPSFFWPDGGEPVPMKSITFGGASSGHGSEPRRSWRNAVAIDGACMELDTTDRPQGDYHYRRWHPIHGAGWLVVIGGASWAKGGPTERWEGDNGTVMPMRVASMKVGFPADWNARGEMKKGFPAESENWFTYELDNGETFVFRVASPEDVPVAAGISERLGRVRPAPKPYVPETPRPSPSAPPPAPQPASRWPDPNAPRSDIDAFVRGRCG